MKKFSVLSFVCSLLALSFPAVAGTISLSGPIVDDASSGIDSANTYTHAISGGSAQTVNGVAFASLNPGSNPAGFNWDTGGFGQNQVLNNFGDWVPTTSLSGTATEALLRDFTYSGNGANNPATQTYSLLGLTAGVTYDARLYVRIWDTDGSGRPLDLSFVNGSENDSAGVVPEDRPSLALGSGDDQQAYFVNYRFTAQTSQLDVVAQVAAIGGANSGSAHLYALSNQEVIPEPSTSLLVAFSALLVLRRRR